MQHFRVGERTAKPAVKRLFGGEGTSRRRSVAEAAFGTSGAYPFQRMVHRENAACHVLSSVLSNHE